MAYAEATGVRQKSCEERIQAQLDYQLGDMREFLEKYERASQLNADDALEDLETRRYEEPISYDKYTVHKIMFSWGGPADWFEVWETDEGITRIVYHFSDWFDHAERELQGEDFGLALDYLQPLLGL